MLQLSDIQKDQKSKKTKQSIINQKMSITIMRNFISKSLIILFLISLTANAQNQKVSDSIDVFLKDKMQKHWLVCEIKKRL